MYSTDTDVREVICTTFLYVCMEPQSMATTPVCELVTFLGAAWRVYFFP